MGDIANAHSSLLGKPERKEPLGRPRHRFGDNIKVDQKWNGVCRLKQVVCSYRKSDKSCPQTFSLFLGDPYYYYSLTYTYFFRMVSLVRIYLPKLYLHFRFEVLKALDYEERYLLRHVAYVFHYKFSDVSKERTASMFRVRQRRCSASSSSQGFLFLSSTMKMETVSSSESPLGTRPQNTTFCTSNLYIPKHEAIRII